MIKNIKKILSIIFLILTLYLLYFFVFGILIFTKDYKLTDENNLNPIDTSIYYQDINGPDNVTLLETGELGLTARFNLIENAKESIKIANFKLESSEVSDVLYALLIERANEGVQVQLLIDGVTHNLHGFRNELYWALATTPNIEVRFYEELDLLRPWRLNNRLHDKIFIVDEEKVLTGGRNIGDNYYLKNKEGRFAYDRDVLISTDSVDNEGSVLHDFNDYYDELWNHEFVVHTEENQLIEFEADGEVGIENLLTMLIAKREQETFYLETDIDWEEISHPTNNISLITNPIERMKQNPRILQILDALMKDANDLIVIQTPYFVWNEELQPILEFDEVNVATHILTNSESSTNNYPGVSGFLKYKDKILENVTQVYGFQGDGSIHAKTYVIDERLSLVGSFNLDPRSSFLSSENLVVIDSESFANELSQNILGLMESSRIYNEEQVILPETVESPDNVPWTRDLLLRITRIVLYPFDELL